jgi:hypothetical protein
MVIPGFWLLGMVEEDVDLIDRHKNPRAGLTLVARKS